MSIKGRFGNPAIEWRPLLYMQEYLNELEGGLRSPDYIRKVKLGLAHFALFCESENVVHPEQITRNHLLRFQGQVNRRDDWTRSYQQQLLKYVKAWINWLYNIGYISENPWHRIKIGRTDKKPKPLADDELALLFEAHRRQAFSDSPFAYHRREVILTLLYGWGLRLHELLALNMANMDLRLEYVTAKNKGGSTKSLPYPQEMKLVVQRYMPHRARHAHMGEDALLIDRNGGRLSEDMGRRIVTKLGERAGISVHPHQLRDTCGTHLLDSDVEVERVMAILGHSNVRQTLAYAKVNNHKVAEAHQSAMGPRITNLLDFGNTRNLEETP